MSKAQKSSIECKRRWAKNNPNKVSEYIKKSNWAKKNRDKINKRRRDDRKGMELLCGIREKHLESMKDDPESMTSEFLNTIQNLGCKKHKKTDSKIS